MSAAPDTEVVAVADTERCGCVWREHVGLVTPFSYLDSLSNA